MKQLVLAIVLMILGGSATAEWTGADWNGWSAERKVRFIEGFVAGSHWVASNSIVSLASFLPDESTQAGAKAAWEQVNKEFSLAIRNPKEKLPPKYNAAEVMFVMMYDGYKKNPLFERAIITSPVQQISDRLDAIFRDPRNLRIPVSGAMYLAKKIIGGLPPEDVNVLLPYLRGEKAVPPGWIIPIYDSNKKFIKVIEFP